MVLAVGMEPNNISDLVDMMKLPTGADRFLQEVHPKLQTGGIGQYGNFAGRNLPGAHGYR